MPQATRGNLNCAAPGADTAVATAGGDQCGCAPGFGWSITTGVGCCKPGSVTQQHEISSCQLTRGNTDCTASTGGSSAAMDACGCAPGFGWSISTGTPCCKLGSITQESEEARCQANYGNAVCTAPTALGPATGPDACGCMPGTGWSVSTGRGCCKPGSNTQPNELETCQADYGNTDCSNGNADGCGCPVGTGWSVTTGIGCCKPGSLTSQAEITSCRATAGNMDCSAPGSNTDKCGCPFGTGWSVTTGRGCCKPGSRTQESEENECQAAYGNTDCHAIGSGLDACGCTAGTGWSTSTGRGCCKPGSITQAFEEQECQVARGNADCTALAGSVPSAGVDKCGCPAGTGWSMTTGVGCCKP